MRFGRREGGLVTNRSPVSPSPVFEAVARGVAAVGAFFVRVVHFIMQRQQLLGITRRAELPPADTLVFGRSPADGRPGRGMTGNSEGRHVATGEEPCLRSHHTR